MASRASIGYQRLCRSIRSLTAPKSHRSATRRQPVGVVRVLRVGLGKPLELSVGLGLDQAKALHVRQRAAERGEVVVGLGAEVANASPQALADERVEVAIGLEPLALTLRRRGDVANPPLAEEVFGPALLSRRHGASASEALRIDVDDRRQLRAPHRRRGGREQARRLRRDAPRVLRLRDELRAVAPAEPQQRRRPEQLRAADPGLQLVERPHDRLELGAGDDDPHEVRERRVAERAAPLELLGEEAPDVVARRVGDRPRVGLERLHDHAPRRVAAAAPRELGDQLERALLGAEVGHREAGVGVDHGGELDPGEVVALGDHLRPEQDAGLGVAEAAERLGHLLGLRDGVRVEPDQLELRQLALELALELLRPGAEAREVGRLAHRAVGRRGSP